MNTKTKPWRHIYHDIEISRPKKHGIEIQVLKHHDIDKQRQLSLDIVVPRHFFGRRVQNRHAERRQQGTSKEISKI